MRAASVLVLYRMSDAQPSQVAKIEQQGEFSTLSVHTFRPLDAIAIALESKFGIAVGAEDPSLQFRGDMLDVSTEVVKIRSGTLAPAKWGFEEKFPVQPDGSPRSVRDLPGSIVTAANAQSQFAYRLDDDGSAFTFVPTRTRDGQGKSIAATPLLDRLITIPFGIRRRNESASLLAKELASQTGLQVSCCQSSVAGYPWGMEEVLFGATGEPARAGDRTRGHPWLLCRILSPVVRLTRFPKCAL